MIESLKLLGPVASTAGAKRYLGAYWGPSPCAIFPSGFNLNPKPGTKDYIYSMDPAFRRCATEIREWFDKNHPVDALPSGYAGPTGVAMSASPLTAVSGWPMNPNPLPIRVNDKFIASLGIADRIPDRALPILDELCRLFFGHHAPATVRLKRDGSTAFPYFLKKVDYKVSATLKIAENLDRFLNLVTSDDPKDLRAALDEFDFVYLYAVFRRMQADSTKEDGSPKDRTAPTEEEARTGSYDGKTVADKTVFTEDGSVLPGAYGMRVRDVFAFNGPGNYFMTSVFSSFRAVYMERFAFCYKTRGREDKQQKASKYALSTGADVKTMDKTIPRDFFDQVAKRMTRYVDPRFVKFMRRCLRAPYVSSNPWRETPATYEPLFGGSPFDPSSWADNCVGLPSGIACNPDMGKLWMTLVYLTRLFDIGVLHHISDIEPFLQGKNPEHALLDSSDDAVFLSNSQAAINRWNDHKSEMAVIGPEVPTLYLGDVFLRDRADQLQVVPNITTFLVNTLSREDSIDAKDIRFIADGHMARAHIYSAAPLYGEVCGFMYESVRRHLGINIDSIYSALSSNFAYDDVNALFKLNPDVIHYRVNPDEVDPTLLETEIASIPAETIYPYIERLFK